MANGSINRKLDPAFGEPTLELVEWIDSQSAFDAWTHIDKIDDDDPLSVGRMLSVGWIVRENDEAILIAPNLGGAYGGGVTPQIADATLIPKVAICKREMI